MTRKYDYAAIASMHFEGEKSYGQIARIIGISRCAVAGIIHRWRNEMER